MKYQNTKNGAVAELVRENKKFKTVTLRDEAGNEKDYSQSTISRWWKKVDEDSTEEKVDSVQEVAAQLAAMTELEEPEDNLVPMPGAEKLAELKEEVCGDGTPLNEVGKEIAQQAKEKAWKAKKEKKISSNCEEVEASTAFIFNLVESNGDVVFVPANGMKMRTFKTGGHMYAKLDFSNKGIRLAVSSKAFEGKKVKSPDKVINHMFNNVYKFSCNLDDKEKGLISDLLKVAREYRISKNNKEDK